MPPRVALNVAEKPSIAKAIAQGLSGGRCQQVSQRTRQTHTTVALGVQCHRMTEPMRHAIHATHDGLIA